MKRILYGLVALLLLPAIASAQSGAINCVSASPTIDTAAYGTGDVMSATAMTFANLLRQQGGKSGVLVSAMISDAAAQGVALDLVLFSTLPAASSFGADNAAFDPTDAQLLTVLGVINFSATTHYFAFNDNAAHYIGSLAMPLKSVVATPGNVYGVLVARGAYDGDADSLQVTLCASVD